MKKFIFFSVMVLIASTTVTVQAQRKRASPHDTLTTRDITVTYGRPYKKGRDVFGGLEKYGKVWRVGADEATEVTFKKAVMIGDKLLEPGTYTMFAIPNEDKWTIIFNTELKQWGAYGYEKIKDKDVVHVDVPVKKLNEPVEQLTISFPAPQSMVIAWDKTQVTVPLAFESKISAD